MEPFDKNRRCPKCGCDDVGSRYQAEIADLPHPAISSRLMIKEEHIQRHCRNCAFRWAEACCGDGWEPVSDYKKCLSQVHELTGSVLAWPPGSSIKAYREMLRQIFYDIADTLEYLEPWEKGEDPDDASLSPRIKLSVAQGKET